MNRPVKAYLTALVAAMIMQAGAAFAQPGGPPGGGGGGGKTTLSDLDCEAGEIAKFDGEEWLCAEDVDTNSNAMTECFEQEVLLADGTCLPVTAFAEALFAPRYVFVTPPDYTGFLGGLAGADAICQEWADSADSLVPAGDYVAILSSTVESALSRVGPSLGPIVKPNGEQVAENTAHLFSLNYDFIDGELFLFNVLVSPIDTLANGEPAERLSLGPVWTGSDPSGRPATDDPAEMCSNWTTADASKIADGIGTFTANVGWIAVDLISASVASPNNRTCDQFRNLYCIQK